MKRIISIIFVLCTLDAFSQSKEVLTLNALSQPKEVILLISDFTGRAVEGAVIENPSINEISYSNVNGRASIIATKGDELIVSLYNKYYKKVIIDNDENSLVVRFDKKDILMTTAFDQQKTVKESTDAAAVINSESIQIANKHQILHSVVGLLPGLQLSNSSTAPWGKFSYIYLRGNGSFMGNNVLCIVDGVERDLKMINSEEVESVTILKDAASLALYGNKGADGVIVVTTKKGANHGLKIKTDYNYTLETPFAMPKMASRDAYLNAVNEAHANDGLDARYSTLDLQSSYIPQVDWQKQIYRTAAHSHDFNISFEGADKRMKYYVYANYHGYSGLYNNSKLNEGYSTQALMSSLKLRSNIEAELSKTTRFKINLMGLISQRQEPASGMNQTAAFDTPSAVFPIKSDDGIWTRSDQFLNPLAEMTAKGYNTFFSRGLYANITLQQDLSILTEGLDFEIMASFDNYASIKDSRTRSYAYYNYNFLYEDGSISGTNLVKRGNDTELSFSSSLLSGENVYTHFTAWAKLNYDRSFGKHNIDVDFLSTIEHLNRRGQNSYSSYLDFIFKTEYNYAGKYYANLVLNAASSAYLMRGDRYRLYPSLSFAWIASEEDFLKGNDKLTFMKINASCGLVGYDSRIGYGVFYPSQSSGGVFIETPGSTISTLSLSNIPATSVQPEVDLKSNLGVELGLWDAFSFSLNGFFNRRSNIRVSSSSIYSTLIGREVPYLFCGRTINYGAELSLSWQKRYGEFNIHIDANLAYSQNRITYMPEEYKPYSYLYKQSYSTSAIQYYPTESLYQVSDFSSDGKLLSGVSSSFISSLQPGDVKYVDTNGDKVIDKYDQVYDRRIQKMPFLNYSIPIGFSYKGFGLEAVFVGIEGSTMPLTLSSVYQPLYENKRNISEYYLANHWSKENTSATLPRLTTLSNNHNFMQNAQIWLQDADWFKLKSLYIYYAFGKDMVGKAKMNELRLFFRVYNLFSIDKIKLFDPEAVTLGYPAVREFQFGVKLTF